MGDLEYQLLRIPSGTHDDLPDALQGLVQLLDYPRSIKKEVSQDSEFDWWRKQAIKLKQPGRKERYLFGKKTRPLTMIPAQTVYR
jgi:hypothetical protein